MALIVCPNCHSKKTKLYNIKSIGRVLTVIACMCVAIILNVKPAGALIPIVLSVITGLKGLNMLAKSNYCICRDCSCQFDDLGLEI